MPDFKLKPIPLGLGGGAALLKALRSGEQGGPAIAPDMSWLIGYKIKVATPTAGFFGRTAAAAAVSQVLNLSTAYASHPFPSNVWVEQVYYRLITPFSGGAVATAVIAIGDTGNDDEWVDDANVFTGATPGVFEDSADVDAVLAVSGVQVNETAYDPNVTITLTGGNVNTLTAGELDVFFRFKSYMDALPASLAVG